MEANNGYLHGYYAGNTFPQGDEMRNLQPSVPPLFHPPRPQDYCYSAQYNQPPLPPSFTSPWLWQQQHNQLHQNQLNRSINMQNQPIRLAPLTLQSQHIRTPAHFSAITNGQLQNQTFFGNNIASSNIISEIKQHYQYREQMEVQNQEQNHRGEEHEYKVGDWADLTVKEEPAIAKREQQVIASIDLTADQPDQKMIRIEEWADVTVKEEEDEVKPTVTKPMNDFTVTSDNSVSQTVTDINVPVSNQSNVDSDTRSRTPTIISVTNQGSNSNSNDDQPDQKLIRIEEWADVTVKEEEDEVKPTVTSDNGVSQTVSDTNLPVSNQSTVDSDTSSRPPPVTSVTNQSASKSKESSSKRSSGSDNRSDDNSTTDEESDESSPENSSKRKRRKSSKRPIPSKVLKCQHCSYETVWSSNLNKHLVSKHTSDEKIKWLQCAHCSYKAKTREYLQIHLFSAHNVGGQMKKCPECSFTTKYHSSLKAHILSKHTSEDQIEWFHCDQCPFKAKTKAQVKQHHAFMHTPAEDRKWFRCTEEDCDFKTKTNKVLKKHVFHRHTPDDKINWQQCQHCDYHFKTAKALKEHQKNQHDPNRPSKRYRNSVIEKEQRPRENLRAPVEIVHEEDCKIDIEECKLNLQL